RGDIHAVDRGRGGGHVNGADGDLVVGAGVRANLDLEGGTGAVQQLGAVEVRIVLHSRDFLRQLLHFLLQRGAVVAAVGAIGGLHGQLADALQVLGDRAQGAFGGLRQRDAVVGVAGGDVHAADLGGHALGDGQAGGVVLGAVDAQAGGQALDGGRHARAAGAQVALRVERHHVGVDDLCHFESPLSDSSRRVGLRKPWPDLRRGVINLTGAAAVFINDAGA